MGPDSEDLSREWEAPNYFNYFTEAEERFQRARGTGLFLMSPLDWALVEAWKNSGVPLEAVLRGIDEAFVKWRLKRSKTQIVNSLAYCTQAVMTEAQRISERPEAASAARTDEAPFSMEELRDYLTTNILDLRPRPEFAEITASLEQLLSQADVHYYDLERLEQWLTALEDKMIAILRSKQNDQEMFQARRELQLQLRAYRGKMTADQLAMLEKQYLDRRLLERAGVPRLSLFYLR
jgi:hypothetical protein